MAEDHNEEEEMIINQEYKIWKKEAPYKYDFLLTRSLEWPTSTFEWLPNIRATPDADYHQAIIGVNSNDGQQCELQKIEIAVPHSGKEETYMKEEGAKFRIVERKSLGHEVNRVRYCHASPQVFAASLSNSQISIHFKNEAPLRLVGHSQEGFGLSWNPISQSLLASGHSDKRICIWDIEKSKVENNRISPLMEINQHAAPVEDVAWHQMHPNILASCSDDRMVMLWDLRFRSSGSAGRPIFEVIAHTNEVYTLDFSPFNEFLFLSGSADENVSMWDMRNLTRSISNFRNKDSVVKVQWSPHFLNLFGCCGYDRKVHVWDLSEAEEGKKEHEEAFFVHEGHRSRVVDFDWNPNVKLMAGSTEDSNCIHCWEIKHELYYKPKE